jgi:hypothetical protein
MELNVFRRVLWHLNRSPGRHAVKAALRALNRDEMAARRREAGRIPRSEAVLDAARSLARDGYVRADALIPIAEREALATAVDEAVRTPHHGSSVFGAHKDIWASAVEGQMVDGQLPTDHPFVRFALNSQILALVAEHYGELPRLDYVSVTRSLPAGPELRFSQLWHRDYDDVRVVKLFVYLTDVNDAADGPFTFIPAPASQRVKPGLRSHLPDAALGAPLSQAVSMTGPRLTSFMVETSRCYHMGSRLAEGHERVMFTATYISAPRIFPERPRNFVALNGTETALARRMLLPG